MILFFVYVCMFACMEMNVLNTACIFYLSPDTMISTGYSQESLNMFCHTQLILNMDMNFIFFPLYAINIWV